jgi:hypothetical protein
MNGNRNDDEGGEMAGEMGGEEVSPGGSRVLRHVAEAPASSEVAYADDERLTAHLDRVLGGERMVWHEIVSQRIHLDVHAYAPTEERPFHVLVTSGMSALPMSVPEGVEYLRFAELCILLPPDWPMTKEAFQNEAAYWPVRLLKSLGRLPHDYATWLGYGHSIPNGHPAEPYAPGVAYSGALLIPPFFLGVECTPVPGAGPDDEPIHLWQVLPVTDTEMELKLELGIEGFLDHFGSPDDEIPARFGPVSRRPPASA